MANKLTLTDFASLTNQSSFLTGLNNNFAAIETLFDTMLSRDGTAPNEMEDVLDMNNNRIINLPEPVDDQEPITYGMFQDLLEIIADLESGDGDGGTSLLGTLDYVLTGTGILTDATFQGFTHTATGALTRTWKSRLADTFHAPDFGILGDGTTNNLDAFVDAFDTISDLGGGILYFPPGNYLITGTTLNLLNSKSNVILQGAGQDATFITLGNSSTYFDLRFGEYIAFRDMTVDGLLGASTTFDVLGSENYEFYNVKVLIPSSCFNVISCSASEYLTVEHCWFEKETASTTLNLCLMAFGQTNGAYNIKFWHNRLINTQIQGLWYDSSFNYNHFTGYQYGAGIGSTGHNIQLIGNLLLDSGALADSDGFRMKAMEVNGYRYVVAHNIMGRNSSDGASFSLEDSVIANNISFDNGLVLTGRAGYSFSHLNAAISRGKGNLMIGNKAFDTYELIDRTTGTNIGNATSGGALAAAFDGTTSQAAAASAQRASATECYIGKQAASALSHKTIGTAIVYGSNDAGYVSGANPTVTIELYGSQLNAAPSNSTDGELLGTTSFTDTANESGNPRTVTNTLDVAKEWASFWVRISHNGSAATMNVAEVQFYTRAAQTQEYGVRFGGANTSQIRFVGNDFRNNKTSEFLTTNMNTDTSFGFYAPYSAITDEVLPRFDDRFGVLQGSLVKISDTGAMAPTVSDGSVLGTTLLQWSDLFLAEGGVINWDNGDILMTQTGDYLDVTGAQRISIKGAGTGTLFMGQFNGATNFVGIGADTSASEVNAANYILLTDLNVTIINARNAAGTIDFRINNTAEANLSSTTFAPTTTDGLALGDTGHQFADLFLAEGGVINWDNGDALLTQTGNIVALTGAALTCDSAVTAMVGTAIPAGGTAGSGFKVSSTANFGIFFGSGLPTLAAAQGSLYLRSDGSTNITRMYVNTDGNTTWTPVNTVG